MLSAAPGPAAATEKKESQFHSWKGLGAAQVLLPDVEEENSSVSSDYDCSDSESNSNSQPFSNSEGEIIAQVLLPDTWPMIEENSAGIDFFCEIENRVNIIDELKAQMTT